MSDEIKATKITERARGATRPPLARRHRAVGEVW